MNVLSKIAFFWFQASFQGISDQLVVLKPSID